MTPIDLGKLAGLLEGEGSFSVNRGRDRIVPRVDFTSTDEDVARWVATRMGARLFGPYPASRHGGLGKKDYWQATAQGARAVGVMLTIYSLLHQRRRARIASIIRDWRAQPTNSGAIGRIWNGGTPAIARCHPAKQHVGRGLCGACWMREKRAGVIGRHTFLRL